MNTETLEASLRQYVEIAQAQDTMNPKRFLLAAQGQDEPTIFGILTVDVNMDRDTPLVEYGFSLYNATPEGSEDPYIVACGDYNKTLLRPDEPRYDPRDTIVYTPIDTASLGVTKTVHYTTESGASCCTVTLSFPSEDIVPILDSAAGVSPSRESAVYLSMAMHAAYIFKQLGIELHNSTT